MPAGSAGSRERDRERERDKKSVFSIAFEASILSTSTDPSFSVSLLQAMPPPSSSAFSSSSSSHSSAAAAAAHDDLVARAVEAGISSHAELPPRVRALLPASEWRAHRERCRVRRFWAGAADEIGHLVHKPGGRGGTWAFDYDPKVDADDEAGFKFDKHRFVPGEYVSIKEHDGVLRTFRIASVADLD